ncbi:hypothetical protein D516_0147 [Rhodobacter sp. AKP1]|nr:hypothetical protein D516_0147 [Rhodobacter sp. AKP1]
MLADRDQRAEHPDRHPPLSFVRFSYITCQLLFVFIRLAFD